MQNLMLDDKVIFLFWHSGEENMPAFHKMNLNNIRKRVEFSGWNVIVTSLDRSSKWYVENLIDLPSYFFDLKNKISDISGIYGNMSDIIRLRLLEKYGGCYLDTSSVLLRDSIDDISLYNKLKTNPQCTLAGYTNVIFTCKGCDGNDYYPSAIDGLELGALFAKKDSPFLKIFNAEIDDYWNWKTANLNYEAYPLFIQNKLTKISFLNEYHIHYSIYHLILKRYRWSHAHVITQSMHMRGKENSSVDGPYSVQDRFCRGVTTYEKASPHKLLKALLPGYLNTHDNHQTSLSDRILLFNESDILIFPGYLRTSLENYFEKIEDYYQKNSAFLYFYNI